MCLIELMLNKIEERTRQNQFQERQREVREAEGASFYSRRIKLEIVCAEVARQLGISPGRVRRFEKGDRVRDPELLKMAYENYLCYVEQYEINICLQTEIQNLRNILSRNTIICEVNGRRWEVPIAASGHRRSVI
ncbi:hypothetical protein SPSIL_052670 [Sporomusa silvacetica DSM 10669]|uniref:HTH cro/C1-type domain-containing protein n=1 Tax=Sporomusa silvacetica DSM 10669 TaxID=1123289 RepID=A0ABZ3ITJ5_9FIRM|nr:hypothetical protein [Sporomusa silvacetica]OZC19642.1 hypothetical protein SPSIL_20720 [Sporomusa silvacetica DSM 10669]